MAGLAGGVSVTVAAKITFILIYLLEDSCTVRILNLSVPDAVRAGTDIRLTCEYDTSGETLRSVKWYKGLHEFYRYFPRDWQHSKKFFLPPGLTLDEGKCDDTSVYLTRVHADMSGYYTCEVTTEELFESVSKKQYLQVVQPPSVSPQISGLPAQLPLNKWLKLTCSLPWMNVTPKLEFYVNGIKTKHRDEMQVQRLMAADNDFSVSRGKMRAFEYKVQNENSELMGTAIVLEYRIGRNSLNSRKQVDFTCRATAAKGLYEEETTVSVNVREEDWFSSSSNNKHLNSSLLTITIAGFLLLSNTLIKC